MVHGVIFAVRQIQGREDVRCCACIEEANAAPIPAHKQAKGTVIQIRHPFLCSGDIHLCLLSIHLVNMHQCIQANAASQVEDAEGASALQDHIEQALNANVDIYHLLSFVVICICGLLCKTILKQIDIKKANKKPMANRRGPSARVCCCSRKRDY